MHQIKLKSSKQRYIFTRYICSTNRPATALQKTAIAKEKSESHDIKVPHTIMTSDILQ